MEQELYVQHQTPISNLISSNVGAEKIANFDKF